MAQRVGHVQKPIKPATSWRDVIKVHPAADLFPLMPEAELRELGEDIKKNGLTSPIVFFKEGTSYSLLDGRNRHADRDERRHHDANECVSPTRGRVEAFIARPHVHGAGGRPSGCVA